jgi:hypothetical protein
VTAAYVWLGDLDRAFAWLERSYADMEPWTVSALREAYDRVTLDDLRWVAFRNDPRYWTFVNRTHLSPLPPSHPGYAEDQAWRARQSRGRRNGRERTTPVGLDCFAAARTPVAGGPSTVRCDEVNHRPHRHFAARGHTIRQRPARFDRSAMRGPPGLERRGFGPGPV